MIWARMLAYITGTVDQELQRRRKGFIGFSRNLLISFDYGQLRQVLMKLVVRLLTEGLQVRILPGEPVTLSLSSIYSHF